VLWPGYIGERYSEGLVLLVGAVHNAEELRTPEMEELAKFAKVWGLGRSKSDSEYLNLLRAAYLKSARREWIPKGQVWRHFQTLVDKLDLCWDRVAFTNWNKCKSPTHSIIHDQKRNALYNKHISEPQEILERLPIRELCPVAVFVCCGNRTVVCELRNACLGSRITRVYNQRGWKSKHPTDQPYRKWLDDDAQAYRTAMSSGGLERWL
jgi:hypothetical protein